MLLNVKYSLISECEIYCASHVIFAGGKYVDAALSIWKKKSLPEGSDFYDCMMG